MHPTKRRCALLLLPWLSACHCEEPLYSFDGQLAGSLCREGGGALINAAVTVETEGGILETRTDAYGEWSLLEVAAGSVTIRAETPSGVRVLSAEVIAGRRTLVEDPACAVRLDRDGGLYCPDFPGTPLGACAPDGGPAGDAAPPDPVDSGALEPGDGGESAEAGAEREVGAEVDAGGGGACVPGTTRSCYPGPPASAGVGPCHAGTEACVFDAAGQPQWGGCLGAVTPGAEICGNGVDESCDGQDDACPPPPVCAPGSSRSCYPGPAGSAGIGVCQAGSELCAADGSGWGGCQGAITPGMEVCGNGVDEDCSGADEVCPPVEVPLFLIGDCVTASCPPATPFPVACNIIMSPGDPRGCVANQPGSPVVFFKAGDQCDQGLVLGSLWCSDTPGAPLGPANCPINKPQPMWVTSAAMCPQ